MKRNGTKRMAVLIVVMDHLSEIEQVPAMPRFKAKSVTSDTAAARYGT